MIRQARRSCRCAACPFDYGERRVQVPVSTREGAIAMKYLILLYADRTELPEPGTAELAAMQAEWGVARQAMTDAGVLIECAPTRTWPAGRSFTSREPSCWPGPAGALKRRGHTGPRSPWRCPPPSARSSPAAWRPSRVRGSDNGPAPAGRPRAGPPRQVRPGARPSRAGGPAEDAPRA